MSHFGHKPLRLLCCAALALFISLACSLNFAQDNPATPSPVSIAIIYDTSYTLIGSGDNKRDAQRTKALSAALSNFVQQAQQNEYFVIGFATEPNLLLDGSTDIKATQRAISKLFSTQRAGATALYDACYLGINKVAQGHYAKKIVIIMSDGIDTVSEKKLNEVQQLLKEAKVVAYVINIGSPDSKFGDAYSEGARNMDKILSKSEGVVFRLQKPTEVNTIFAQLAEKIRNQ